MTKGFFTKKETRSDSRPDGKAYSCFSCGLHKDCETPKMKPSGGFRKGILNIGTVAEVADDLAGKPFQGKAGRKLTKVYKSLGVNLERDCLNVNAVHCLTLNKDGERREPSNYEIDCCRRSLRAIIKEHEPKVIVLLGSSALYSVLKGIWLKDLGKVDKWRGYTIPDQHYGTWLCPTFDPILVEKYDRREMEIIWKADLKQAIEKASKPFPVYQPPEIEYLADLNPLNSITSDAVAFDYEATGLKPHAKGHKIVCAAVATSENHVYTFPFPSSKNDRAPFVQLMQDFLIKKIAQNMKFEDNWTNVRARTDVMGWDWDTMLASHVLDNRSGITGLKFQTYVNFGVADYDSEIHQYLVSEEDSGNNLNTIVEAMKDPDIRKKILEYCALDAIFTFRLSVIQKKKIEAVPGLLDAYKLLHDGVLVLAKAERQGFRIDIKYIEKKKKHLERRIKREENKFKTSKFFREWQRHSKSTVNINSPDQLADFLYNVKKLKPPKLTKSGKGSTDEEALNALNLPELETYLYSKKLKKMIDYLSAYEREQVNGFIHPFFDLHIPVTYRGSSSNPNFQNVPIRDDEARLTVRRAIYPRRGHQILEADFSSLEVCIATCYHKDPKMIKYIEDNYDMHGEMAEAIYGIKNFDKSNLEHRHLRSAAKNGFVFPEFYGDWFKPCAEALAVKWGELPKGKWKPGEGVKIDDEHLSDLFISQGITELGKVKRNKHGHSTYTGFLERIKELEDDLWENRFPHYARWKKKFYKLYQKKAYVQMKSGFRCTGLMGKNDVINWPVQGSAFHCLLWCLIQISEELERKGMKTVLIGQVHDSVIADVWPPELEDVKKIIKRITTVDLLNHFKWINVPLNVDGEVCPVDGSWAEKEECEM